MDPLALGAPPAGLFGVLSGLALNVAPSGARQ
jgi:hypothetical protein